MFDQNQRHGNAQNLAAHIRTHRKAFDKFAELQESKEFQKDLNYALANPNSKVAKEVLGQVMSVVRASASKTTLSPLDSAYSVSKMLSMIRRYGPPSIFLTVSPDDVNNPTSFRLTFYSRNNDTFPAKASDDFFEKLQEGTPFAVAEVEIPLDYINLLRRAEGNSVATSMEFHTMLCSMFEALIGVPMNAIDQGAVKKTVHCALRKNKSKGLFGTLLAAYGVIEESRRRALHLHIVLWGGMPPRLLQKVAAYPYLWKEVTKVLGTMCKAEISREQHLLRLLNQQQRRKDIDLSRRERNKPTSLSKTMHRPTPEGKTSYDIAVNASASRTNVHEHSFTCHKGASGKTMCRMAFGKLLCQEARPVQISYYLATVQEEEEEREEGADGQQEN